MANAIPSSPGRTSDGVVQRTINIKTGDKIGRREDGRVVRRTYMENGNYVDNYVFEGDHKNVKPLPAEKKGD